MSYILGIDLGGTRIKAVAAKPSGLLIAQREHTFQQDVPMDWAVQTRALYQSLQKELGDAPSRVGLSAPGLAARNGASIAFMPGRLHGLEGLNWQQYLGTSMTVPVLNDAHAALLGEVWLGAARGFQDVFLLTLGTGVGGAILSDGKLLKGHLGRGGHLGHVTVNTEGPQDIVGTPGSLEDCIGNCSIRQRSQNRFQSTYDLVTAHLAGDAGATAIWLKSVYALACAIASFINILDSEAVIIGGGVAKAGPALFNPLQAHLDTIEWRPGGNKAKILPATMGEYAGAFGAAYNALHTPTT